MSFTVIIPARLASTRLPNKPLAEIGGVPMIVRVAHAAALSSASQIVVAADHDSIVRACKDHGIACVLTDVNHLSGSDRLAQAVDLLGLADDAVVVNVQGDEPLVDAALIDAVAALLTHTSHAPMGTACHSVESVADYMNPNVVKVVLNAQGLAINFSRAPTPFWRDGFDAATGQFAALPTPAPLRHIGVYSYRAHFLRQFVTLAAAPNEQIESLEQLRVLWHGYAIAVATVAHAPGTGVDTPADLERVRAVFAGRVKSNQK